VLVCKHRYWTPLLVLLHIRKKCEEERKGRDWLVKVVFFVVYVVVVYGREDLSWPCCQPWRSSSTCVCGRVFYETGSTTPTHGGRIR